MQLSPWILFTKCLWYCDPNLVNKSVSVTFIHRGLNLAQVTTVRLSWHDGSTVMTKTNYGHEYTLTIQIKQHSVRNFCNYGHIELLIAVCRMWLWYNRAANIDPPEHSIDDTAPHLFDRYQNGNKCISIFVFEDVHEMISDTNYWIQLIKTRNVFPCKIGLNHQINPSIVTLHWFILVKICMTKLHRIFRSLSWNAIDLIFSLQYISPKSLSKWNTNKI